MLHRFFSLTLALVFGLSSFYGIVIAHSHHHDGDEVRMESATQAHPVHKHGLPAHHHPLDHNKGCCTIETQNIFLSSHNRLRVLPYVSVFKKDVHITLIKLACLIQQQHRSLGNLTLSMCIPPPKLPGEVFFVSSGLRAPPVVPSIG